MAMACKHVSIPSTLNRMGAEVIHLTRTLCMGHRIGRGRRCDSMPAKAAGAPVVGTIYCTAI